MDPEVAVETEAPEAAETDEPIAAEVETPEVPAGPDWGARVDEWGGEERISDALAIAEALATEDGVRALVREGLASLNLDPDKAFALAAGEELPDPDELLTRQQMEDMLSQRDQSFAERQRQRDEAVAFAAVDAKLGELQVTDEAERSMVLSLAQRYVSPDEMDPARLQAAIDRGYADFDRLLDARAQRSLEARAAKNQSVPKPLRGGGQPAGEVIEKPEGSKNFDDWKAAARKFLASQKDQEDL